MNYHTSGESGRTWIDEVVRMQVSRYNRKTLNFVWSCWCWWWRAEDGRDIVCLATRDPRNIVAFVCVISSPDVFFFSQTKQDQERSESDKRTVLKAESEWKLSISTRDVQAKRVRRDTDADININIYICRNEVTAAGGSFLKGTRFCGCVLVLLRLLFFFFSSPESSHTLVNILLCLKGCFRVLQDTRR